MHERRPGDVGSTDHGRLTLCSIDRSVQTTQHAGVNCHAEAERHYDSMAQWVMLVSVVRLPPLMTFSLTDNLFHCDLRYAKVLHVGCIILTTAESIIMRVSLSILLTHLGLHYVRSSLSVDSSLTPSITLSLLA